MALVPGQLGLQSKTFEREEEGRERERGGETETEIIHLGTFYWLG